jgi:hypothetical protein
VYGVRRLNGMNPHEPPQFCAEQTMRLGSDGRSVVPSLCGTVMVIPACVLVLGETASTGPTAVGEMMLAVRGFASGTASAEVPGRGAATAEATVTRARATMEVKPRMLV